MLGTIIGDIVGSRFEFNNHRSKDFTFFHETCEATDDSIMTLAVAKAIMEAGKIGSIKGAHDLWNRQFYRQLERLVVTYLQEIGRNYPHCGYGGRFGQWVFSRDPKPYNSFGNGAAMRISPVAFAGRTETEVRLLSEVVTRVTHNHPEGLKGAEATALAIYLARQGLDKETIRKRIDPYFYSLDFTIAEIRATYQFNETCQQTVPQAIVAFLEANSFEDAIRTAISVGGDSDTLGAITGAIAEAYYGVPKELEEKALSYLDPFLLAIYQEWQTYLKQGPKALVVREAHPSEREFLFREGYKQWPKNRSFEEYVQDNQKEDDYGTRYVLTVDEKILSSAIVLRLESIHSQPVYGLGSILTAAAQQGKGYATTLIKDCISRLEKAEEVLIFLYSDIDPGFYEKLGFKVLPKQLQKSCKSPCMVRCGETSFTKLLTATPEMIPDYF